MMFLMILRQNPGAEEVLEVDFEAFPNVSKGFRCLAEVRKTVPSFFQILAAEPPKGLGVELWACDPESGRRLRRLGVEDLEPRK